MSDLVRFGVAMDRTLLAAFDRRIAARGYENRSEALRDLVRADLARGDWEHGGHVAATLTVVYDARARDPLAEVVDEHAGHDGGDTHTPGPAGVVLGSLRLPLARGRVLEVMALSGAAPALTSLAGRIGGARGVLSCELTLAAGAFDAAAEGQGTA